MLFGEFEIHHGTSGITLVSGPRLHVPEQGRQERGRASRLYPRLHALEATSDQARGRIPTHTSNASRLHGISTCPGEDDGNGTTGCPTGDERIEIECVVGFCSG
jgi:hypothetical protein